MRKYGHENFDFEWICSSLSKSNLDELEQYFIQYYNSYRRGYNMTCGGNSCSEETKEKLRQIFKGRTIDWYDKVISTKRLNGTLGGKKAFYEIRGPDGCKYFGKGIAEFCRQHNLDQSNLTKTLTGRNCCKGYILIATFNDYPEREYSQATGNGERR